MDSRKGYPYVSCIKVYGVPIIPPLMTEDVRAEMRYYKHLAEAVEERLARLESLARSEVFDSTETIERSGVTEKSSNSATLVNGAINATSVSSSPKEECAEDNEEKESKERESRESRSTEYEKTSLDATTRSAEEAKTDTNDSSKSYETSVTLENASESKKPEVPKTLDIIPITMDNTTTDEASRRGSEDSCDTSAMSLTSERAIGSTTSSPNSDETTPKLVRQGSYVLDSPGPMLLAHLREEKSAESSYAPTSAVGNSLKRKEWNIGEAKSEWELRRRKETALVAKDAGCSANRRKDGARRNSASNASQARSVARRCAQTRAGSNNQLGETRRIARSADCIRSMLRRDTETSSIVVTNGRAKNLSFSSPSASSSLSPSPPLPGTRTTSHRGARRGSVSSLSNKLANSLENLGKSSTPRHAERCALPVETSRLRESPKNSEKVATARNRVPEGFTDKIVSSVTSKRLADVFRQIQNTHERQLSELVARQLREQQSMREEFEKQRVSLLAQIERSFPGIKLPGLADDKISSLNCRTIQRGNTPEVAIDAAENSVTSPKRSNGFREYNDKSNGRCPLDDIYPREKSLEQPSSPPIGHVSSNQRKNHAVSRRLFPLESNTSRVPVYIAYEQRHVNAAITINAYARGYLVRRIMKTERVVALKITYGEALRCMLKLHVDAPLALPELNFHQRLQLQCEAASMNIVELFTQQPAKRMEIIEQDRQIKRARQERPNSARSSYSFATQRTLARKKLKEMGDFQTILGSRSIGSRNRCQTWTSDARDKYTPSAMNQGIKRSTSAGAVRKPWR